MTNPMTTSLTRPIIGIENRTAQEVFDIMCDRIRRHNTEADALREALAKLVSAADSAAWLVNTSLMDAAIHEARAALKQEPKDARP